MRWFRRIAIGVVALAVLVGIGVAALLVLVDPNSYKAPVADAIKKRYARTLRIDGDLKLAIFPRLGVEVEKLSLSEPNSTQIFAVIDTARVSVALLPLFSRRLVVDHLKVSGLKANVVRYKNGQFNFDDLLATAQNNDLQSAPVPVDQATAGVITAEGTSLQMDVAGVEFSGGELAYRDFMNGNSVRFERLSATTGRMAPGLPFAFTASARVLGQQPRVDASIESQGTLMFDQATRLYAASDLDIRASGVLPSVRATSFIARGNASYDGKRQAVDGAGISVMFQGDVAGSTPLTGVEARLDAPQISASLDEGRLQLEKLAVSAKGKAGADPFDFSLSAPRLAISEQAASGEAISGRMRLTGQPGVDARFSLIGVSGNGERLSVAQLAVNSEFKQGPRTVKVNGTSPFEANLKLKSFALAAIAVEVQIEDPALPDQGMHIPVTGSARADIERETFNARVEAVVEGGKVSASADVAQFDEPRVSFSLAADTLDLDKLWPGARKPAGGTTATGNRPAADPAVDLGVLQGITANGSVRIGKLVVRGLKAGEVAANLRLANGRADLTGIKAVLYGGTLSGSVFADANTGRVGAAPTLSNVSIQPLLLDLVQKDTLIGRGTLAMNLSASGKSVSALKKGLNGTLQMQLRDGAVKGINLAQSLREFKAMVGAGTDSATQADQARQTDFSEMQARVVFANGIGTVRSLNLKAPLLRVEQGDPARIDVAHGALDLVVLAHVSNTSTGQDGKELAQLRNVAIPVHLTGALHAPSYKIQWSRLGADLLKENVKTQIEEKLGLGDKAQREQLKDNVRERLKGLFNR